MKSATSKTPNEDKIKILVVDDEADIRDIVINTLDDPFYIFQQAEDGIHGLESAMNFSPDLVISDIKMPRMDGPTFIKNLRAEGFDNPVIFLSAFGDKTSAILGLKLGLSDFVDKPFKPEELRNVIYRVLDIHRRELELGYERGHLDSKTLQKKKRILGLMKVKKVS